MPDYTSLNEGQIRSTYNNNRAINEREEIEAKADLDYFNRRINDPIKKEIDQVNNTFSPRSRLKYPLEKQDLYQGQILFTPIITTPPRIQGGGFSKKLKDHIMRPQEVNEFLGGEPTGGDGQTVEEIKNQSQSGEFVDNTSLNEGQNVGITEAERTATENFSSQGDDLTGTDFLSKSQTTFGNTSVQLYIPTGVTFSDGINYNAANLNTLGTVGLAGIEQGGGLVQSLKEGVTRSFAGVGDMLRGQVQDQGLARLAAVRIANQVPGFFAGQEIQSAIKIGLQTRLNPNRKSLFEDVDLRPFTFTFSFIATSRRESAEIGKIIKFFRKEAYPENISPPDETGAGDIPIGYKFPNKFDIKMQVRDKFGRFVRYGYKVKPCYLRRITTNFNPGSYSYHDDGTPFQIDMTLDFIEFSTLSKEDIEEGF
tara:strand:+ start:3242 stop:4513 length:1272 start_codon:yes stop_codon:yes gene_type:complete